MLELASRAVIGGSCSHGVANAGNPIGIVAGDDEDAEPVFFPLGARAGPIVNG